MELVSVIMPVYNAERFVAKAIQSVLGQSYQNLELVVVDDGSTDGSWQIVNSFADPRMRVFRQLNQGACVARNRGIAESKGKYLKFLDADDVLYPDAIAMQVEQMSQMADNEVVFGDFDYLDAEDHIFAENHIDAEVYANYNQDAWFLAHWFMLTGTPLHRREWIEKVKGFNVRLRRGQESFLHFSLSMAGVRFVYKPGKIYQYRSYESETRITTHYTSTMPMLSDVVYRLDTFWSMVKEKYGTGPSRLSTILSQKYFTQADKYFANGMAAEGKYCLRRAQEIPHTGHSPRYRHSHKLYCLYVLIGHLFGYVNASCIIGWVASAMGVKEVKSARFERVKYGKK